MAKIIQLDTDGMGESATLVAEFEHCVSEIEENRGKLIVVGRAFKLIRDNWKTWGPSDQTWESWCRSTWSMSKTAVNFLIGQADVAQQLKLPDDFPSTRLRPLVGLTADHRQEAWEAAMTTARDHSWPSGASIKMAASKFREKPISDWTVRAALAVLDNAVRRGIERALATATAEQQRQFLDDALRCRFDHYKEVLCGPT